MVRRYAEPVRVESARMESGGTPQAFCWRGAHYRVCQVLASWQERRAWWSSEHGAAALDAEREVWRVEASRGGAGAGVYDLCRDFAAGDVAEETERPGDAWLLLRVAD